MDTEGANGDITSMTLSGLLNGITVTSKSIEEKLETLHGQYEDQLHNLRTEIDRSRKRRSSKEDDGSGGSEASTENKPYSEMQDTLGSRLGTEDKQKLDSLVSHMDKQHKQELEDLHRQHVDDAEDQVKFMRITLEEIYNSQLELMRSELEQSHQTSILDMRETLDKQHKDEINKVEQEWNIRLEQVKQDYEEQLMEEKLGGSLGEKEGAEFIRDLNQRLTEEHRKIIAKIESELESQPLSSKLRESKDSQTDEDSVASAPTTRAEFDHIHDKQSVLENADKVQKSLETQVDEIEALRAQMLAEYEQMLATRAEVMSSQSEEVEKLQREMTDIREKYENEMTEFEEKVKQQTEVTVRSELAASHAKELEDMKTFYETKVTHMEQSYSTDIEQLKQEHAELLARLQQETDSVSDMPSSLASPERHRKYVRATTQLTAISDEDETPPSTPTEGDAVMESRVKLLESKLKDKENIVDQLRRRLDSESTSAEDLHEKLLDSTKTLEEFEESVKSKSDEIDQLKEILVMKDKQISDLESEKASLEEGGEKDKSDSDSGDNKLIEELKYRIKKLEEELSASKQTNAKIKDEMQKLDAQHGEAVMKLKEEMENLNKIKIEELEAVFQIQLEEELKQQAEELENKNKQELARQTQELEIYKQTESELKQKLDEIQTENEKQLSDLRDKYEEEVESVKKDKAASDVMVKELSESQLTSPGDTLDRESLEAEMRESIKSEILQEYEESIDKLKSDYEDRISDLNEQLQTFQSQGPEKATPSDNDESSIREQLALEFKDKLEKVIDEYESKLKHLQNIVDGKKEVTKPSAPPVLGRSRSLDRIPSQERSRTPVEYEGYVSTIRKEYEDKISSLQKEIAQYKSSAGPVPLSPLIPIPLKARPMQAESGDKVTEKSSPVKAAPDSTSVMKKYDQVPDQVKEEMYDEIAKEFENSYKSLRDDYEKKLEELNGKLEVLQTDSGIQAEFENIIRDQVAKEYEEKIDQLKKDYEAQIATLKENHEGEVKALTEKLDKAESEKLAAEQKVKADMFVWHEEIVTQLKKKHEDSIAEIRKEFEEKMELYKEEVQEEFDGEKENMFQTHKDQIATLEERYDKLVEGLRSGDVPEVSELFREKFDMELEMAKTLIQQECDETIESEQSRLSEQFEQQLKDMLEEKEKELEEQKAKYDKDMAEMRESIKQEYETKISDMETKYKTEMDEMNLKLEAALAKSERDVTESEKEAKTADSAKESDKTVKSQESLESTKEDKEKEEEQEKVTSTDSGSDKDNDNKDDGPGGAKVAARGTSPAESADKHEGTSKPASQTSNSSDVTDGAGVKNDSEQAEEPTETKNDKHVMDEVKEEVVEKVEAVKAEVVKASVSKAKDLEKSMLEDQEDEEDAADGAPEEDRPVQEKVVKMVVETVEADKTVGLEAGIDQSEILAQLREELAAKIEEYEDVIAQLKSTREEEVKQLTDELTNLEANHEAKIQEMEEKHEIEVKQLEETIEKIKEGVDVEDTEAMEAAHQQELQDLEERLVQKHMNEINNLATQHQDNLDKLKQQQMSEVETLEQRLMEAQRAVEQYPDGGSPSQTVPSFHGDSTMESSKELTEDFMVPTQASQAEAEPRSEPKSESVGGTGETQVFSGHTPDDITDSTEEPSLMGTLEDVGVKSLDETLEQSREAPLRGMDDTVDTEMIEFSEEEDKSIDEGTQKSDCSTPPVLLQTLSYGAEVSINPTVKSLDDTTDSFIRVSEREDLGVRMKELEAEVEELRNRLQAELNKQDDQMERLDREKQEERNLVAMLREDIERLNTDRDSMQTTNEHLLGLLSDAVKTYMSVEETITKKMKAMMDKSGDKAAQAHPGSAERKKTPPLTRKSPSPSPGRLSPARAEDGENVQETSILSNITDEGLDLSQRISDSIFQGPDLASEEEELLIDSSSRLRNSVGHLLNMIEETTTQLLDGRTAQTDMVDTIQVKGQEMESLRSQVTDLEETLKEEVKHKDFLALELHKAEGLIEGYASEQETLYKKFQELEEQKETLVLDLETTKNKLLDLESMKSENDRLRKEMTEQRELMTHNVGDEAQASRPKDVSHDSSVENKALLLEVSRLNSENHEREEQIKQVHENYEKRVRDLETSGEDMEQHYGKLLDEKKQEVADLKLQVESLEKQIKAKKQFLEEQSAERDQEHEDYQTELDKWKTRVQDLEKHNGAESRRQRDIDDLTEQLQTRIDLHNQALLESEKYQREAQDKELSNKELKTIIQQLEQDLQEKTKELESNIEKLKKLEDELSKRPDTDEDLSDSSKSGPQSIKTNLSVDFDSGMDGRVERAGPQLTVEEEIRQAANKTKEELVREKFALQTQVNENLVQISGLRTQLDEMRYLRGVPGTGDVIDAAKRLEMERDKSDEKDQQISELKLQIEQLQEQRDRAKLTRGSPVEAMEFEHDKETERQIQALQRENKQLRERVKLAEVSGTTDMSGLSQNLIDEKNQEIDHLSEQILRLQSDLNDLKAERGVENLYDEVEILRDELKQKEREVTELQSNVRVSATFTDHSLTPDCSLLNVGASFSEKASIQQEMQESVATNLEKVANLETELQALKATLQSKEDHIVTLEQELAGVREQLKAKDERIVEIEKKQDEVEDANLLQAAIQEKESLITQLTVEVEHLQTEVTDLSDFQIKLQEDYEVVQNMLEEKYREIESLTKELTDKSPDVGDEHALVIKHEVEIARLKKDLREKDNVIDEKMEELAELTDKLELLESHIDKYKEQVKDYDDQIGDKDKTIRKLSKDLDHATLIPDEKDKLIDELKKEIEVISLGKPPPPPGFEDDSFTTIIQEQKDQIENLLGSPPSSPRSDEDPEVTITKQQSEIKRLTVELELAKSEVQGLRDKLEALSVARPATPPAEDDQAGLVRDLQLENQILQDEVDAALTSQTMTEDEKRELIKEQKAEIDNLKSQLEYVMSASQTLSKSEEEHSEIISAKEEEIKVLKKQVEAALTVKPPPIPQDEEKELELVKRELEESKAKLESLSLESVKSLEETVEEKEKEIQKKEDELKASEDTIRRLEEDLESVKEVRAYEDEIERQEKNEEIEELKAELEKYTSREDSSLAQSVDLELSESGTADSGNLVRSVSFYKEQYEEKCAEARQLQVQLDLIKQQLEKARSDRLDDAGEEIELYKADLERRGKAEIEAIKTEKEKIEKEIADVKKEFDEANRKLSLTVDERVKELEQDLEKVKDDLATERKDNVQAINDMEKLRERKEKERKDSVKAMQELEQDLEEKTKKEEEMRTQMKQLKEELKSVKKQYDSEYKTGSESSRASPKSVEAKSDSPFELATEVETLQSQVLHYKQHADKAKEVLVEKQKYQTQLVKLEIQYEQLQKTMRKEVSRLEEQLKSYSSQPDQDVWIQLHATQERLEKTTEQLSETARRLSDTESKLQKIGHELSSKDSEMTQLQQELWKTANHLSTTSGKLQDTEEKLRQALGQVSEREEQIHQLQGELQHTQHEVDKRSKSPSPSQEEVDHLHRQLSTSQTELEAVKSSLKEAVDMSEQQLQQAESKDQEYVKLKLDIQQTIADKDKLIREQRQKLKDKDQEVTKSKQEVTKAKDEVTKVKQTLEEERHSRASSATSDDATTIASLRSQLQNQEEVILALESDLCDARSVISERECEIKDIHHDIERRRKAEADTMTAMTNQMSILQQEVEEMRSVSKLHGLSYSNLRPGSTHTRDETREQSPLDQNGHRVSPTGDTLTTENRISDRHTASPMSGSRRESPVYESRTDESHRPVDSRRSSDERMSPSETSSVQSTTYESRQNYKLGQVGSRRSSDETYERRLITPEECLISRSQEASKHSSPRDSIHSSSGHGSRRISPVEQQAYVPEDIERSIYSPAHQQQNRQSPQDVRRRSPTDGADHGSPASRGTCSASRMVDSQGRSPDEGLPIDSGVRVCEDTRHQTEVAQQTRGISPALSKHHEPAYGQLFPTPGRSFEDQDSGHQSFEPRGGSPPFGPEGQSLSPRQLKPYVGDPSQGDIRQATSRPESIQSFRGTVPPSPPTRDRPDANVTVRPRSASQRSSSHRSTPSDGDDRQRHDRRASPQDRNASALFTLEGDRLVETGPQVYESYEQYRTENGQFYDRDDNIRPRYAHAAEGQCQSISSRSSPRSQDREEGRQERIMPEEPTYQDEESRVLARQSQEALAEMLQRHPESLRTEGDQLSERSSRGHESAQPVEGRITPAEADRTIQQLRRELLITKTALMQIQKGERLDSEAGDLDEADLDLRDAARGQPVTLETLGDHGRGDMSFESVRAPSGRADMRYEPMPDEGEINYLRRQLERAHEELELFRTSSNLSARDFVQKVMGLKDELSSEHQRHIQEMTTRNHQDTETQLAAMRIKYTDEIDHIQHLHMKELEERLRDLQLKLERKHKSETNKMVVRHQEEVAALKTTAGLDFDETSVHERLQRQRECGINGHSAEPMSAKLQGILRRLHNEGVQVLTISELEILNRSQSQGDIPTDASLDSMKAGWEYERQTMISTIQSLKDLLAQTHKLRGLDKSMEGSDWRAELLRAIGYVFTKERDSLLAELRSHVLSHPSANMDEIQRLEAKIRNMESHHHAALDQINNADRQSMLAEIRDLRAHATIARLQQHEERDRYSEKIAITEDTALKNERQLKRKVQLLEFKIQQEKVLQDDLRTSLDVERARTNDLNTALNHEKSSNLDLSSTLTSLQTQVAKLREGLEREQSRYVSITNALEEEKSKSLNLSDLLESERQMLWRTQAELDTLKQQQSYAEPRAFEQLQKELNAERELRCQADSQHEIDQVTIHNLQQELDMVRRRQGAIESELQAKVSQLQRALDNERDKQSEFNRVLERERSLAAHLQQNLEVEKDQSERQNGRDAAAIEDLTLQLDMERANLEDLNVALQREQAAKKETDSEKNLLKDHLNQERGLIEELKQDLDRVQFERLEAVNKLQKEHEMIGRVKSERDQLDEELQKLKNLETQREHNREAERLSNKETVRQVDKQREDLRMKLNEQELETQRLTQKCLRLEEELAETQESELRTVRELELLKLDIHTTDDSAVMVSVQTSPRRDYHQDSSLRSDVTEEQRERYTVYRSQLESMCQSLHYLVLRCREQVNKHSHSSRSSSEHGDVDSIQRSLWDLLSEVKQLQEMEGDFISHPSGSVNERILRQNEELTNFVSRISEEKTEMRNKLIQLEEEIWKYRQLDSKYQAMQRSADVSEHQLVAEKAEWAKEKLSLQMALNSAEREIGLLQTDLRVERERRVAAGNTETVDSDKVKIQRLYGKYLRAESFRKALIYQKKYLLMLLGGYKDTEETTLALLASMGATEEHRHSPRRTRIALLTTFRGAVRVVIAIQRMKFLVKKWRRATRVGSEVVGGAVDQSNGYMPNSSSYSPARATTHTSRVTSFHARSSSPLHTNMSSGATISVTQRHPSPSRTHTILSTSDVHPQFDLESFSSSSYHSPRPVNSLSHVHSTPPTKDYSSATKYMSPTSGARRKILTSTSIPAPRADRVRFSGSSSSVAHEGRNGDVVGDSDDYIHRLESLQSRLGTLQNGKKESWKHPWR